MTGSTAHPMIASLDHISKLLHDVDDIRTGVEDLNAGTRGMGEAKVAARKAGAHLFDAVTDYQRAMLNELYGPKVHQPVAEEVKKK